MWGCGPVGLFAIKSAYLLGAERVIGIDRLDYQLEMARSKCGAETVNYEQVDSVSQTLKEMTAGRGPDACIDAVGMEAASEVQPHAADAPCPIMVSARAAFEFAFSHSDQLSCRPAAATGDREGDDNTIADLERLHDSPDPHRLAHELVTEDVALLHRRHEAVIEMQIRPANRRGVTAPSERECDVWRLVSRGYSNKEIALRLGVSVKTIEVHKANGMHKLGLSGRIELVRYAVHQVWRHDVDNTAAGLTAHGGESQYNRSRAVDAADGGQASASEFSAFGVLASSSHRFEPRTSIPTVRPAELLEQHIAETRIR